MDLSVNLPDCAIAGAYGDTVHTPRDLRGQFGVKSDFNHTDVNIPTEPSANGSVKECVSHPEEIPIFSKLCNPQKRNHPVNLNANSDLPKLSSIASKTSRFSDVSVFGRY